MYSYRDQLNLKGETKRNLVLIGNYWAEVHDDNPLLIQSLTTHEVSYLKFRVSKTNPYSARSLRLNLIYDTGQAIMVWKRRKSDIGRYGIQCVLFCNKSDIVSSNLIEEGQKLAREMFEDEHYFVYLDPTEKNHQLLKDSFLKANWEKVGTTKKNNFDILEVILKD